MQCKPRNYREASLAGYIEKGTAAFETGDYLSAISYFKEAIKIDKHNARLWNDLGQTYRAIHRLNDANECYSCAAELDDSFADPLNNLGVLSRQAGELDSAEEYYKEALSRCQTFPEVHYNLALLMEARGDLNSAKRSYRQAISLRPNYMYAQNNLGVLLINEGQLEEAERLLEGALLAHKRSPELLTSFGTCMRNKGNLIKATNAYRKAIRIKPDFFEAIWNLALVDLATGRFKDGWNNYRYRPTVDRAIYPIPKDAFAQDVSLRSFEIHAEQGPGDELFFLRFLPLLSSRGAKVQYYPNRLIKEICIRAMGDFLVSEISNESEKLALPDLPFLLGSPDPQPTIQVRPLDKNVKIVRAALTRAGPPPYIGVTYRAGLNQTGSLFKEVPLEEFGHSLSDVVGTFINVQRLPLEGEPEKLNNALGKPAANFSSFNNDLEAMLALMEILDEYVGVSNTNMHLRAAVSKPAKVLVTHPAEYRWMSDGASPWFPEFKLYRQSRTGSWNAAFKALSMDLAIF